MKNDKSINNNEEVEIVFRRQPPKERIPLYKLSNDELLNEYEQKSAYVFDRMPIDPLSIYEKDAILNPYRDEIMRRIEQK